jgi:NADH-quinone oxidoreductase subunit N
LIEASPTWAPALAVLAAVTIVVGNVGALSQGSLKRMLAYSSVAQAGYMLAGVVVASALGVRATVLYLVVYLFMNLAAFAVIVARERETGLGDSMDSIAGIGRSRPWLAWPLTLSMLGLAGIPATAGFVGKFYLIAAAVSGGYTWLGVVIVIGSMISLAYYLPVVAAMWMREAPAEAQVASAQEDLSGVGALPAIAGGSQELDSDASASDEAGASEHVSGEQRSAGVSQEAGEERAVGDAQPEVDEAPPRTGTQPEVVLVAVLAGAATLFFGIVPQPLFDFVSHAARGLGLF